MKGSINDGDLFGDDDVYGEEFGGDDWQADASTVLAATGGQAEAATAEAPAAPATELPRQESAEAGRALFVRAVSREEESEFKGEGTAGAAGAAGGGSSAGPRKTAPVDERVMLRGIYEALGGPEHWRMKWDLDQPVNRLHGVTCDKRGRVVEIDLANNGLRGDLSKVQWPAALQKLDLQECYEITGDLSKVQWPEGLQSLSLTYTEVSAHLSRIRSWPASLQKLDLSYCGQTAGDFSKVQWPAVLQSLNLEACQKIEGDLLKAQLPAGLQDLNLMATEVSGDLSKVQWPAGLQDLDLRYTAVSAPPGCPTNATSSLYYNSKEACDELRGWIASQTTRGGSSSGSI